MSSPLPGAEAQFEALVITLGELTRANYSEAAALATLVFDVLLTFGEEVEYIWKSRWSIPKVLFFVARYFAIVYLIIDVSVASVPRPNLEFCRFYFWFYSFAGLPLFAPLINTILIVRLYSLYERSKRILAITIFLLLSQSVFGYYVAIDQCITDAKNAFVSPPGVPLPGCLTVPLPQPVLTIISWTLSLLTATSYFFIMLMKFARLSLANRRISNTNFLPPILSAFFRDGVIFFLLPLAAEVFSAISDLAFARPLQAVGFPWYITIYSISASRLILGLRAAAHCENPENSWAQTMSMSFLNAPA